MGRQGLQRIRRTTSDTSPPTKQPTQGQLVDDGAPVQSGGEKSKIGLGSERRKGEEVR